jgi:enolase-phosphatase E1
MPAFKNIKLVLTDIEGTTSDIEFVKNVLFPYSAKKLPKFLNKHHLREDVRALLNELPEPDLDKKTKALLNFIKEDVKHPVLKTLQGYIWQEGYEQGEYKSHLYPDVKPKLEKWHSSGVVLGIYSSGSIEAQKLFFSHTISGNILPLFHYQFDLSIGGKKESLSYKKILQKTGFEGSSVLFLSDIEEELFAAKAAGLHVLQIVRPGTKISESMPSATSFSGIELN